MSKKTKPIEALVQAREMAKEELKGFDKAVERVVGKPKRKKKLKMFVWQGVLCDYTPGMMVALAYDVKEARELLKKKLPDYRWEEIDSTPRVVRKPKAFYVYGGG